MIIKILTDRVNQEADVKEVRNEWLGDLLLYLGLDTKGILEVPRDIAVEYLVENNVEIIEYTGMGAVEVRYQGEVVGEWGGPEFHLKEDKGDGSIYFEATVEHWSIIEDEIENTYE